MVNYYISKQSKCFPLQDLNRRIQLFDSAFFLRIHRMISPHPLVTSFGLFSHVARLPIHISRRSRPPPIMDGSSKMNGGES
nr:hypothetical protein Q903MT_gene6119 [Picea sitchensis]